MFRTKQEVILVDLEHLKWNLLGNFHKNKANFDTMPLDLDIEVQGHLK